jgi:Gas vesicle synthesis protein GvpL/GvpF
VARPTSQKYVYGITRTSPKSKSFGKGINGKAVRVIATDGLAALTSDVPRGVLQAGREELMSHAHVLERALAKDTVLPMRFGVVMPDESAVRTELLKAHQDQLGAQLDEMDGKFEINLKGMYEEDLVLRELMDKNSEISTLSAAIAGKPEEATYYDRIRLGELVATVLADKRAADEQHILERLSRHAVQVEISDPVHERMVVSASFLVERDRQAKFDLELDEIASENQGMIRFKYTGPLPPHSFVELAMEA